MVWKSLCFSALILFISDRRLASADSLFFTNWSQCASTFVSAPVKIGVFFLSATYLIHSFSFQARNSFPIFLRVACLTFNTSSGVAQYGRVKYDKSLAQRYSFDLSLTKLLFPPFFGRCHS